MAIDLNEALNIISNIIPKYTYEIIPLENVQKRICFEEIIASTSLPKFNNSAMDAYAIIYEQKDEELKVINSIFAGDDKKFLIENQTCIKVMTGAEIPKNTTAIIPFEDVININDNTIKIKNDVKKFQHIRYVGEDIKEGDILIQKKEELNFSKITLLASQGLSHIKVLKEPKVAIFTSGEELKPHYEKAEDFQIYNSNTPTLIARLKELACRVTFMGQAKDNVNSIKELISNSLDTNLIITTGGMSVGDADFTKEAFKSFNFEVLFDGLKIKPGKPTMLGKINNTYILNLPGNPLASILVFEVIGKTLIQKLQGSKKIFPNYIQAKLKNSYKNKAGRISIIPGFFDGVYFEVSKKFSPSMVRVLSSCNSMIILDEKVQNLQKDSIVKVLPISWNFFTDSKKDFFSYE